MIKFGTTKYISKQELANAKLKRKNDEYSMLCNWHKFFAIFPRRIVEGDVTYLAVGSMYRRGLESTEDYTHYKWVWEYAGEFSSETRVSIDPRTQLRGKMMV